MQTSEKTPCLIWTIERNIRKSSGHTLKPEHLRINFMEDKTMAANVFPMPQALVMDESTATNKYAKFTAQPFQSGFGHTIDPDCGDGGSFQRRKQNSAQ